MPFFRNRRQPSTASVNERPGLAYQYRPLTGGDEFRILKVSPVQHGLGRFGMPTLKLRHFNLSDPPNYVAISYMWGNERYEDEIVVDNRILRVQADVKPMIHDLQDVNQSFYIWIDAVCINQQDNIERSAQVRLIGDIYRRAIEVKAYLRGDNYHSSRIGQQIGSRYGSRSLSTILESVREQAIRGSVVPLMRAVDHGRLFNNNYFDRRWIIQEIGLARSVIIRCDGNELSMGLLERYFEMLGSEHEHNNSRAAKICNWRRRISTEESKLEDLLYNHESAVCKDRLDKVYALLSLSGPAKDFIPVDYAIQPLKLLISVVKMAFEHEDLKESRVLSFACFLQQHLSITAREFANGMDELLASQEVETDLPFSLCVQVRGILGRRDVRADIEDGLNRSRHWLPQLRHYHPIHLNLGTIDNAVDETSQMTYIFDADAFFTDGVFRRGRSIGGANLWVFCFEPLSHPSSSSTQQETVLAGVSSGTVDVGDEVWQFARTPVALVARQTENGYTVVARALILNDAVWRPVRNNHVAGMSRGPNLNIEHVLAWIEDVNTDTEHPVSRTIAVGTRDLLGLMRWVGSFDE